MRVLLGGRDDADLRVVAARGMHAEEIVGMRIPIEGTVAGDAFRSGRDARGRGRHERPAGAISRPIEPLRPGPIVYAPLLAVDETLGVLSVDNAKGGRAFEALDIEVITSFARQAALAMDLARSRGHQDTIRTLEDRERIGRNLHDTVIQRLFAVGMQLQGTLMADPASHRERIGQAIDEIDTTIKEIRTSIFLLSTPPAHGVRQEVTSIVDGYAERAGWLARVGFDGPVDSAIPDALVQHVEAVIREAVSNIARHANAHRVDVTVDVGPDIVVVVADDGDGIPADQTRRSGLANLERRAEELGGRFTVETGSDGTRLTWTVPLPT